MRDGLLRERSECASAAAGGAVERAACGADAVAARGSGVATNATPVLSLSSSSSASSSQSQSPSTSSSPIGCSCSNLVWCQDIADTFYATTSLTVLRRSYGLEGLPSHEFEDGVR